MPLNNWFDPKILLEANNVSDILSCEENEKLEKLFDDYITTRSSEYECIHWFEDIVNDFLYMIHNNSLPRSPLRRKRRDLQPYLDGIQSLFSWIKKDLSDLKISINKEEYKKGKEWNTRVAYSKWYFDYSKTAGNLIKSTIKKFWNTDSSLDFINYTYQIPFSVENLHDILKIINTLPINERENGLYYATYFTSRKFLPYLIEELLQYYDKSNNKEAILGLIVDKYHKGSFSVDWDSLIIEWGLHSVDTQDIHCETKKQLLMFLLNRWKISTIEELRKYKNFDLDENKDIILGYIKSKDYSRLINSKLKNICDFFGKETLINFIKKSKTSKLIKMELNVLQDILSKDDLISLTYFILNKDKWWFFDNKTIIYKERGFDEKQITSINSHLTKEINQENQKNIYEIEQLVNKYSLDDITYKEKSIIFAYKEVDNIFKIKKVIDFIEKSLYYYPPPIIKWKKIIITWWKWGVWWYAWLAPDKNTIVINADYKAWWLIHHELFHTKDREDGIWKDDKNFEKNSNNKVVNKEHRSIVWKINEYQASQWEMLFKNDEIFNENFIEEYNSFENILWKDSHHFLKKKWRKFVLTKEMREKIHIHFNEKSVAEEKEKMIEKFLLKIRSLELISWCEIGSIWEWDLKKIKFTKIIDDRKRYWYEKNSSKWWPEYWAKRMDWVVKPQERLKFFNAVQDWSFNWRKKGKDWYRNIIESQKTE